MHILIISESYLPKQGAIESNLSGLSKCWLDAGHRVSVITATLDGRKNKEKIAGVRVYRFDLFKRSLKAPFEVMSNIELIRPLLEEIRPDIALTTNNSSAGSIQLLRKMEIPAVYQCVGWGALCTHGHRFFKPNSEICWNQKSSFHCFKCKLQALMKQEIIYDPIAWLRNIKWSYLDTKIRLNKFYQIENVLLNADYHAWVSSLTQKLFHSGPGEVIPNAVDIELFNPIKKNKKPCIRNLPETYILTTSRIHETKGIIFAVEALTLLPTNIKLIIVGNSKLHNSGVKFEDTQYLRFIKNRIKTLELEERVMFTGLLNRQEMSILYANALAHITPSIWLEPFGNVVTEALASGTPVVVTETTGAKDFVVDGVNGFIVRSGVSQDIADSVIKIVSAGSVMRLNARASVEHRGSFQTVSGKYINLFNRLRKKG